jgi:predicted RNA binding protein YcfA (HicA-like mRNA interferase family)
MAQDVRFSELRRKLEAHGWYLDRINGSHHIFQHPTKGSLSIPVHRNKVKAVYARKVDKACEEEKK